MNSREFLEVAEHLAAEAGEGYWRSAVSRADYAVFHAVLVGCTTLPDPPT
jgi:uncharacterized protein (UPF0332 family)